MTSDGFACGCGWEGRMTAHGVCDIEIHFIHMAAEILCVLALNCCCDTCPHIQWLTQHTCILLKVLKSEFQKEHCGAETQVLQGWLLLGARGEPAACLSPHTCSRCLPWLISPSSIFRASRIASLGQRLSVSASCSHDHIS